MSFSSGEISGKRSSEISQLGSSQVQLQLYDRDGSLKRSIDSNEVILNELMSMLSERSTAQAVYFNKVDVQQVDTSIQTSIVDGILLKSDNLHKRYPHIIFFDAAWRLISPSKWYVKLVTECLNLSVEDVQGKFTGNFNRFKCENSGFVYKPEIEAGSYNPYKKICIARQSSSRRMKVLNYFNKASNKELSLMQMVVTLPKEISNDLFDDSEGRKKFHKITTLFAKKFDLFLRRHAKVSEDFQSGFWLNEHSWSSKKPLNNHLHGHFYYPNIFVDKKTQEIYRFKPFFSGEQIYTIKLLWKESIRSVIGDHESLQGEIDIYHRYSGKKREKLHLLKYCTRSWLHDLGKYFSVCQEGKDDVRFSNYFEWMKRRFGKFVDWGAIENRTYALGFLHNTKKIFSKYGLYNDFRKDDVRFCDVCGNRQHKLERVEGFPKVPEIAILMAYKSSYLMVGVLGRIKNETRVQV